MKAKYMNKFIQRECEMTLAQYKYLHNYFNTAFSRPGKSILFSLLCAENLKLLNEKYESFSELANSLMDGDYTNVEEEYTRRLQRLVMQYADRDEQGSPILDGNKQPVVIDQIAEFQKAQDVLQNEFTEKFKNAADMEKKYYTALETTKVKVPMIFFPTLEEYPESLEPEFIVAIEDLI